MPTPKKPKATGQAAEVAQILASSSPPDRASSAGRPTKLTPETEQRFLSYVRAGAYAWVAAESAGFGRTTLYRWLEQGEADEAAGLATPYREFRDKVRQAYADGRVAAEAKVRAADPLAWLRYGPGRERSGEPGWTNTGDGQVGGPAVTAIKIEVVYVDHPAGGVAPAPPPLPANGHRRGKAV
jgi:hypothetical protein